MQIFSKATSRHSQIVSLAKWYQVQDFNWLKKKKKKKPLDSPETFQFCEALVAQISPRKPTAEFCICHYANTDYSI